MPHRPRPERTSAALILFLGVAGLLGSCSTDAPTGASTDLQDPALAKASGGKVSVCHGDGSHAKILEVAEPALKAHLGHGDYLTTLMVTHATGQPENGVYFGRIGDALDAARTGRLARGELASAACRITISISAETYLGTATGPATGTVESYPLIVDVPDITLHGALVMGLDAEGRATGMGTADGETTLAPTDAMPILNGVTTPIIVANAHPAGSAGNGLIVEGFAFLSGHDPAIDAGGQGVLSVRATGVVIRGNRFGGGFTESVDIRGGGADVLQNYLAGTAGTCDVCLAGPGRFRAVGNYLLAGGIPGIIIVPTVGLPVPAGVEPSVLPAAAETWGEIRNNEVRDHQRIPVGTGIRVDAIGVLAPNVHGTVHADIRDNTLVNNRFGIIVHAAFPVNGSDRKGDADVTLGGNEFQQTCQANLLVSLSRHTTALGLTNNPYLLNSTFQLTLNGNVNWDDVWYGHAAGFGNHLIVDGVEIANGNRQFYEAAGCPGLQAGF